MSLIGRNNPNYKPKNEYYTPKWLFDELKIVFDLDPAHPQVQTNVPTRQYLTIEDDGLTKEWIGNVWLNPPFSETKLWVKKFIEHRNGIALLPLTKSKWLADIWNDCEGVLPLPDSIKFEYEGKTNKGIFPPVALFAYTQVNIEALKNLNIGRVR